VLLGEGLEELVFVDKAAVESGLPDAAAATFGFFENFPELLFGDEAQVNEDLSKLAPAA